MTAQPENLRPLWIGTYPAAGAGTPAGLGEGIWRVGLDPATGALLDARLVAETPAPSFLVAHPTAPVLYAVGEQHDGSVTSFDVVGDSLRPRVTVASGGADPCHLLLDHDARTLLVANYSSGTLGVLPLDAEGRFDDEVLAAGGPAQVLGHTGAGPHQERQEAPHAHFVATAPGGHHVLVVDLGTDEVRRYSRDLESGLLTEDGVAVKLPPGTGPRHLAFGADGSRAYVAGELDSSVHVLAWDGPTARGEVVQTLPAASTGDPDRRLPAHVLIDGDRLLVGVRGPDVVATFWVDDDGLLRPDDEHALPGSWPRHHVVVDGWTVVAQQEDGGLVVLDAGGARVGSAAVPSPACVVVGRG
ncbi:lactonase family protein [Cellulomonas sp. URHB0016]